MSTQVHGSHERMDTGYFGCPSLAWTLTQLRLWDSTLLCSYFLKAHVTSIVLARANTHVLMNQCAHVPYVRTAGLHLLKSMALARAPMPETHDPSSGTLTPTRQEWPGASMDLRACMCIMCKQVRAAGDLTRRMQETVVRDAVGALARPRQDQ